jgi:ribosomal protein S18 acetylase RimI-like enzyme
VTFAYRIETLTSVHKRDRFASGSEPLDVYFRDRVSQDIRRRLTACFVAVDTATADIAGYYTLSASSIPLDQLGAELRSKLPRYPLVPAVRLGRLAIDRSHQGKGLGGTLLLNALARAIKSEITAYAMVVDAKDAEAAAFYRHHGFLPFDSVALTFYLPLAEIAKRI